jgi:glyoxylase-like metal-dependent hydrolase (beta-lactamase superfamily II)
MNKVDIIKTHYLIFKNYTYLIQNLDNRTAIVIDPSWQREKYDHLIEHDHLRLTAIFVTHHHIDHSNLAGELAAEYKCPVYMLAEEIDYYSFKCTNLQPIASDVTQIDAGGIIVKIIRTPGHTYGGACFMVDDNLFSGDTLFIEGCGMCNINGGDPRRMFASLQMLKEIIPDTTKIYPGHQYHHKIGKSFKDVKNLNTYLNFKTEEEFVKFRMRDGQKGLLDFT